MNHKRTFILLSFISVVTLSGLTSCTPSENSISPPPPTYAPPPTISPEAIEYITPYIVQIIFIATNLSDGRNFVNIPLGTGFLVYRDGYVITANHVIDVGQRYLQQTHAESKKLGIVVPPYPGIGTTFSPKPEFIHTNDFDVIDKDEQHEIILLKIKTIDTIRSGPDWVTSLMHGVYFSSGSGGSGTLALINSPIFVETASPQRGTAVGESGYPLKITVSDATLITGSGFVTSTESLHIKDAKIPGAPEGFLLKELKDAYYTDITGDQGNSGSPVYSVNNGSVLGVCVRITNPSGGSSLSILVPAHYVTELLDKNGIGWTKAN